MRKIIHIDMDAFYASVEQNDNSDLCGKPVAVGGSRQRGVVAAASYEARKYGVKSAMPSSHAARICPNLIFVKPRFDRYKEISDQIREIFFDYTSLVEPLSLDEAYLDVTHNHKGLPSATLIAKEIRDRIKSETGLTASAGISVNKFIAKVASDINKPDGMTLIPPDKVDEFIAELPIAKFFGIGKVTATRMQGLGIHKGADLRTFERHELLRLFGKAGSYYFEIARGIDERKVKPDRLRKSVGAEQTYAIDITTYDQQIRAIEDLSEIVAGRIKRTELKGRTISLKIRDGNFKTTSRSLTLEDYFSSYDEILNHSLYLAQQEVLPENIRLLGISISNLNNQLPVNDSGQLTLNF